MPAYILLLTPGIFTATLATPRLILGNTCLRTIFSMSSGTVTTTFGRTFAIASTSILGAGILPRSVTWAPTASGESMSMAQP